MWTPSVSYTHLDVYKRQALEPAQTDYYYYALGKDGRHHFSATLEQHNAFLSSADYAG